MSSGGTFSFDEEPGDAPERPEQRYRILGTLGEGAMGVVARAHDSWLDRDVAMKQIHSHLANNAGLLARFAAEARTTAQLDHPAIVPVHDYGILDDGRPFYTMPIVSGRTLEAVLEKLDRTDVGAIRRALDGLLLVCRGIGHAHQRGVVHRDLKPANLLFPPDGAVRVVDWGIARVLEEFGGEKAVRATPGTPSCADEVVGTPNWMSPEQRRGDGSRLGPPTDVFALGRILATVLDGTTGAVFEGLRALADHAMQPRPEDRPPDGHAFADALERWLTGQTQRLRAEELVENAREDFDRSRQLFEKGRSDLLRAYDELDGQVDRELREAAWAIEREGEDLIRQARLAVQDGMECLITAVELDPSSPRAHEMLAQHYTRLHQDAELTRPGDAPALMQRVAYHARRIPKGFGQRAHLVQYASGRGRLTFRTDPEGATVEARPVQTGIRGLRVEGAPIELGRTPLEEEPIPAGEWVLVVRHADTATIRVPIDVPRAACWTDARLDDRPLRPLRLPRTDELDNDDVFVARGRFYAGHSDLLGGAWERWMLWVDDFVMKRDPVTVGEYLAFLHSLDEDGRSADADRHAPPGGSIRRGDDGRFGIFPDEEGDVWPLRWPMLWIRFDSARAYATWLRARTGLPWRLPGSLEWEKAARGVAGRLYPWGMRREDAFSRLVGSHEFGPTTVDDLPPFDVSPYGVRGLGGNAQDWCEALGRVHCRDPSMLRRWQTPPGMASLRGNGWSSTVYPSSKLRFRRPNSLSQHVGFRLVRSLGDSEPMA